MLGHNIVPQIAGSVTSGVIKESRAAGEARLSVEQQVKLAETLLFAIRSWGKGIAA